MKVEERVDEQATAPSADQASGRRPANEGQIAAAVEAAYILEAVRR